MTLPPSAQAVLDKALAPTFDDICEMFTFWTEKAYRWKYAYSGAAYSTRIKAAIVDLKEAIAECEKHPELTPNTLAHDIAAASAPTPTETGPLFVGKPVQDTGRVSDDELYKVLCSGKATAEDQRYAAGWIATLADKRSAPAVEPSNSVGDWWLVIRTIAHGRNDFLYDQAPDILNRLLNEPQARAALVRLLSAPGDGQ